MNKGIILLVFGGLFFCSQSLIAQSGSYSINGDGIQEDCRTYRLTLDAPSQSSAIWNNTSVDLRNNFNFKFSVMLGKKGDSKGADGIAFVLQPINTNIGSSGGGMGYEGIFPSIAITMDTYQNSDQGDPKFQHITIQADGEVNHLQGVDLTEPVKIVDNSNNISDNKYHDFEVKWDATEQMFRGYIDGILRVEANVDISEDFFFGVPVCYWGFTGSTGAFSNLQKFREALEPRFSFEFPDCDITKPTKFFDNSFSFHPISKYTWDFGDGTPISNEQNPVHAFVTAGKYKVKLLIENSKGCRDSIIKEILLQGQQAPLALYNYSIKGNTVSFKGDSSNGVYKWIWDFGDRSVGSNNINPDHTYLSNGTYKVKLIVFNACGSDTIMFDVKIDGSSGSGGNTAVDSRTRKAYKNFAVYPNPFQEDLNVLVKNLKGKKLNIVLFNQIGKLVYQSNEYMLTSNNEMISLNNLNLDRGIYIIQFTYSGGRQSLKVIKN